MDNYSSQTHSLVKPLSEVQMSTSIGSFQSQHLCKKKGSSQCHMSSNSRTEKPSGHRKLATTASKELCMHSSITLSSLTEIEMYRHQPRYKWPQVKWYTPTTNSPIINSKTKLGTAGEAQGQEKSQQRQAGRSTTADRNHRHS